LWRRGLSIGKTIRSLAGPIPTLSWVLNRGAGPTRDEREKGFYDILFLGELPHGGRVEAVVTGDRDPGYGSTSKMIAESALCLVRDVQGEGGTWTPGALMGPALRKRLRERAGLTFSAR
jgi:short subunit dehydrogenase-like uncharacterized protein